VNLQLQSEWWFPNRFIEHNDNTVQQICREPLLKLILE
jgi:hypothetical protein